MSYTRLGDLTSDMARQDGAAAFIVAKLARAKGFDADGIRDAYLPSRHVPRQLHDKILKAAVPSMTTTSGLAPATPAEAAFLGATTRRSVLGPLGPLTVNGGNIIATVQTGSAVATWEGESAPKRVRSLAFTNAGLALRKLTSIVVMSEELANLSTPDALGIVQRSLVSAAASALDVALLDPTSTAIAGVKPGSLTAGLTPVTASGDFSNNVAQVLAAISDGQPSRPVLIGSLLTLLRIGNADLLDRLGVRLIVSPAAGPRLIAVDSDGILVNGGSVELTTGQPDLQLDDAPDATSTSTTVLVGLWQRDMIAARVEMWIAWTVRPGSVALLTVA